MKKIIMPYRYGTVELEPVGDGNLGIADYGPRGGLRGVLVVNPLQAIAIATYIKEWALSEIK